MPNQTKTVPVETELSLCLFAFTFVLVKQGYWHIWEHGFSTREQLYVALNGTIFPYGLLDFDLPT